jgi:hypothetical protein
MITRRNLSKTIVLCATNILFILTETQWVFSIIVFLLLSIDILIFLSGMILRDGHNWKDTHLYITPFYFSQDFLRRKNSQRNKFIWTFENHMYMLVLKLNLDFEVLRSIFCRFKNNMFFYCNHKFLLKNKINTFICEILESILNNLQLIPSFFPLVMGF